MRPECKLLVIVIVIDLEKFWFQQRVPNLISKQLINKQFDDISRNNPVEDIPAKIYALKNKIIRFTNEIDPQFLEKVGSSLG